MDSLNNTWSSDGKTMRRMCREELPWRRIKCIRLHAIISCSDIDPTYPLYGKDISVQFGQLDDIDKQNSPLFHVHDVGHDIMNAQASLEMVTHSDATTYKIETIFLPAVTKCIESYP